MMSRWDKSHEVEAFTLVDPVFTLISPTDEAHVTGGEKKRGESDKQLAGTVLNYC